MEENHFLKKIFNEQNFTPEDFEKIISQYQRITFEKNDYDKEEFKSSFKK